MFQRSLLTVSKLCTQFKGRIFSLKDTAYDDFFIRSVRTVYIVKSFFFYSTDKIS
jgi:hypothetical protein